MPAERAAITENIQKYISRADWKSAISEMEKLFAIDGDPLVRVRIGDARQKLGQKSEAVKEYVRAADLYAEKGFVVKALAQYKLALRLDPVNTYVQKKIESLHSNQSVARHKAEPVETDSPAPSQSVIPLFADFTQEEFNDFTKRMIIHSAPPGKTIIREGEAGSSVYVIIRGRVKVSTISKGQEIDLAMLGPSDFFGEIAFLTGRPRTATVVAVEETELLEVPEEELLDLIAKRPRIKEILQRHYEQRVQSTVEKVKGSIYGQS